MKKLQIIEKTNWQIITGGPSTGKSKTIDHFAFLGYSIRPEIARIIIDEEISRGKTIKEIRKDEKLFEKKILDIKLKVEKNTPKNQLIFWERGLPDSIVYLKKCGCDYKKVVELSKKKKYKNIFLLDILPVYVNDYARIESRKLAEKIHNDLYKCYEELGYKVIRVPVAPISERVKFILSHID